MRSTNEFDAIRPYEGDEIPAAIERVWKSGRFFEIFSPICNVSEEVLRDTFKHDIRTPQDYQHYVWGPFTDFILKNSASELTFSDLDALDKKGSYLFISNHRDIVLDSAILNLILQRNGYLPCRTAIGDNLFVNEWVTDMMKLASCFVIERSLSMRDILASSLLRSRYMRETIRENEFSIWIAEREGRTKNGDDKAQPSLFKMLRMGGPSDFVTNFKELNIVAVSISYEVESCDVLKVVESYMKHHTGYHKTKDLDFLAMQTGLLNWKGRIHYNFTPLTLEDLKRCSGEANNNLRANALASLFYEKIYRSYKLWPNNYIAYDLLTGSERYGDRYSAEERSAFERMLGERLERAAKSYGATIEAVATEEASTSEDTVEGSLDLTKLPPFDRGEARRLFLEIYANPVKNIENIL